MDEILFLVEQIEGKKEDDGVKIFWVSEERGSFTEYKKGKNHDLCIKTKKDFLDYFPFEKVWMEFCGIQNEYVKYIRIQNLKFEIDKKVDYIQSSFNNDYADLLSWVKEKVQEVIQELKDGVYNDKVKKELPYEYRYGIINRKAYYEHFPEARENVYKGITEEEKNRFLKIVEKEGDEYIPIERFKDMTFNKFFEMVYPCYVAINKNVSESKKETFFAVADDFGGRVLEDEIDYNSQQDFDDFVDDKKGNLGGHHWGIIRGSSRSRIMLFPIRDEDGYYFQFSGNPNWNIYGIIKCYLALKDSGAPVYFPCAEEIIKYIKEEDLLGFVPSDVFPVCCQLSFPNMEVNDFLHYEKEHLKIYDLVEWLPMKEANLKV